MGQRGRAMWRGGCLRATVSCALALLTLAAVACGGSDVVAGGTPGYSGDTREVDRSGFEIARPASEAGPTTLPGPAPTLSRAGETTTTVEFVPPSPTTTVLPLQIELPDNDDPVCRAFFIAASGIRSGQVLVAQAEQTGASVDFADIRDPLRASMVAAAEHLAPRLGGAGTNDVVTIMHRRLRSTADLLARTTSFDQASGFMYELVAAPPRQGETLGWPDVEAYLNRACPSLIRDLTGTTTLHG